MTIHITKRDGTTEPFDTTKINATLLTASQGVADPLQKIVQIARELQLTLFDGMTTKQLEETLIQTVVQNIKDDPDYDTIAARLLLGTIYRDLLGVYTTDEELMVCSTRACKMRRSLTSSAWLPHSTPAKIR